MYAIHFRRNARTRNDFVRLDQNGFATLDFAKEARKLSGDLVVDLRTGLVVDSEEWLWDWEKADPMCYARRAMKMDRRL